MIKEFTKIFNSSKYGQVVATLYESSGMIVINYLHDGKVQSKTERISSKALLIDKFKNINVSKCAKFIGRSL